MNNEQIETLTRQVYALTSIAVVTGGNLLIKLIGELTQQQIMLKAPRFKDRHNTKIKLKIDSIESQIELLKVALRELGVPIEEQ